MSSLHAEYLEQEEENRLENLEQQQAQEESHSHFVMQEFANLILEAGPHAVFYDFKKSNPVAYEEIKICINKNAIYSEAFVLCEDLKKDSKGRYK